MGMPGLQGVYGTRMSGLRGRGIEELGWQWVRNAGARGRWRTARRSLAAFGLFILLGGGASVAIRITYAELPPFWSAAARFFIAAQH